MENQTNQLADLIMAIIQEKVDERIEQKVNDLQEGLNSTSCLLYTSPSPRDGLLSRMPSSA